MSRVLKSPAMNAQQRRAIYIVSPVGEAQATATMSPAAASARILELEAQLVLHQTELEAAARDGYRRGFSEGMEEGRMRAEVDYDRLHAELADKFATALKAFEEHLRDSGDLTCRLTELVLARMLGEKAHRADTIRALVINELSQLPRASVLKITLASSDIEEPELFHAHLDQAGYGDVGLVLDAALKSGSCRIALDRGILNCDLDRQFEMLVAQLSGALKNVD